MIYMDRFAHICHQHAIRNLSILFILSKYSTDILDSACMGN
jgi:hypothetical protein